MNNRHPRQWLVRNVGWGTYGPCGPLVRAPRLIPGYAWFSWLAVGSLGTHDPLMSRNLSIQLEDSNRRPPEVRLGERGIDYPPRFVRGQLIRQRPPRTGIQNNCFAAVPRAWW